MGAPKACNLTLTPLPLQLCMFCRRTAFKDVLLVFYNQICKWLDCRPAQTSAGVQVTLAQLSWVDQMVYNTLNGDKETQK